MQLGDAINGYLLFKSSRASAQTIKTDTVLLNQFLAYAGNMDVADISGDIVRDYLNFHKDRGLSPHTIHRHRAILSALFAWLASDEVGLVEINPVSRVPAPKLPRLKPKALSRESIEALVSACDKANCKRRAKALILFLLDTGARASEVCGVTPADVNLKTGKVKVRGKGDKERFVYLGKRALSALWLYTKDERPEPAPNVDNLFLTDDGYSLDRHTLRGILDRLGQAAGVKVTAHQFRHTSAIEHLRAGMDLATLQHLLGHESITTTRIYLEALTDEDTETAARRTSPGDSWKL
jgi:integrase/recombinase XerD